MTMLDGCTTWPADIAQRYRDAGYWRGETLPDQLRRWAQRSGARTALVDGDRRVSYAELDEMADRLAAGFRAQGIVAGDRVVVQLPNCVEFVSVCFGLFRVDAKPVFALLAHRADEIGHLCEVSGAVAYVVAGRHAGFDYTALAARMIARGNALRRVFVRDGSVPDAPAIRAAFVALADVAAEPAQLPGTDPSDVAFFLLSGGTTALPKLIPRTHDDYAYQLRVTADLLGLTARDVYLAALPVEFNFAWGCPGVLGTLSAGGTVVLVDTPDPLDCFEVITQERVTFTSLVPTLVQLWLDAADEFGYHPGTLRTIQVGGAPLSRVIAERVAPTFGARLQQVFGMAEGLLSFTRDTDPAESVLSTQGRPVSPADEIRIVDEDDRPVPVGTSGELLARGPYTLRGYYRAPRHNARAFTADGFYRTGDLARLTERGELVITGRAKDVIIRGGQKISAADVETHLLSHPAIDRAAVVGVPDDYLGERICACVRVIGTVPSLAGVRAALRARGIADYKLPDQLVVVAELPVTGLGKVDKNALLSAIDPPRAVPQPRAHLGMDRS